MLVSKKTGISADCHNFPSRSNLESPSAACHDARRRRRDQQLVRRRAILATGLPWRVMTAGLPAERGVDHRTGGLWLRRGIGGHDL